MTFPLTVRPGTSETQDAHTILTETALDLEKSQRVLRGIRTKPNSLTWHMPSHQQKTATQCFVNYKNIFSPTTLVCPVPFCKRKSNYCGTKLPQKETQTDLLESAPGPDKLSNTQFSRPSVTIHQIKRGLRSCSPWGCVQSDTTGNQGVQRRILKTWVSSMLQLLTLPVILEQDYSAKVGYSNTPRAHIIILYPL